MRRLIIFLLLAVWLFSCEKKLDYTLPEGENHIVINSILNATADTVLVNVSWSKPTAQLLDTNLFVSDAQVEMYENDNFLLDLSPRGWKGYYEAHYTVKQGAAYTIKVRYNGQEAEGETVVPQDPVFTSEVTDTSGSLIKGEITVHDRKDEENFYLIGVQFNQPYVYDTLFVQDTMIFLYKFSRRDILRFVFAEFGPVEASLPGIVDGFAFSDKMFDGQSFTFHWYAVHVPTDTIFVQLYAIDRNLYEFFDTFTRSEIANNNPFAQPANVYTNVQGGLGLVASLTYVEDTLILSRSIQK